MTSVPARIVQGAFALALVGFGILGLVKGAYAPIGTGVPANFPARDAAPYVCALISILCGAGLLWRRSAPAAAAGLLVFLILWLLTVRLAGVLQSAGAWWSAGETAIMIAAAWVLYRDASERRVAPLPRFVQSAFAARVAALLFGLGLIPIGLAHFTYFARTVSMVPSWLPWHQAWAVFTGAAFIAAGLGVASGVAARLAATLAAWEITLVTVMVWVPMIRHGSLSAFNWQEVVTGVVLMLASAVFAMSYHGAAWLGNTRPRV